MPTEEQVKECLGEILVPGAMRSLGRLNLVRKINVSDKKVHITLAGAALNSDTHEWLKSKISEGTGSLPGIEQANVGHSKMTETLP